MPDYIKAADQFLIDTAYSHGYQDNAEARKAVLMFSKRLTDQQEEEISKLMKEVEASERFEALHPQAIQGTALQEITFKAEDVLPIPPFNVCY